MSKSTPLDISPGDHFGHFLVLKLARPYYYRCRCDCGRTRTVYYNALLCDDDPKCGVCKNADERQGKIGQVIGNWTVERYRQGVWWCRCQCGVGTRGFCSWKSLLAAAANNSVCVKCNGRRHRNEGLRAIVAACMAASIPPGTLANFTNVSRQRVYALARKIKKENET